MKFEFKLERGEWIHISPLYHGAMKLEPQKPKDFNGRVAWRTEYSGRVKKYREELRALGLKNEARTNEEAAALYEKLKPIADKYNLELEAGRACNL